MTRQLLAFSRKEIADPIVLDLNAAIRDARKMLRRMIGEDIVIETSLDPELGCARLDPSHFVQVLMNLAVNSRDAMPRGGKFSVSTRRIDGEALVEISDTGCGMSPEVLEKMFEPFFTTKGAGKGTGLGLAVVHGIVVQAGGRVEVASQPGLGATFRIYLPRVDEPAEPIANLAAAGAQGMETIMLVDDDVFVRRCTSRVLRARGYQVVEAGDGPTALRLLKDHDRNVSLLLTDVVMPGMDGCELVQQARSRRPTLKVLYMTGYSDDATLRHGIEANCNVIVEKPLRSHVLAGRVREILDS
jgi:two-component system cell cycle sensor histidine kinase/response regulator CckA